MPTHIKAHQKAKVEKVMGEFKRRTLKSSSGSKVTNRKQAVAIAMSESGMSRKKKEHKSSGSPFKVGIGSHVQHL